MCNSPRFHLHRDLKNVDEGCNLFDGVIVRQRSGNAKELRIEYRAESGKRKEKWVSWDGVSQFVPQARIDAWLQAHPVLPDAPAAAAVVQIPVAVVPAVPVIAAVQAGQPHPAVPKAQVARQAACNVQAIPAGTKSHFDDSVESVRAAIQSGPAPRPVYPPVGEFKGDSADDDDDDDDDDEQSYNPVDDKVSYTNFFWRCLNLLKLISETRALG